MKEIATFYDYARLCNYYSKKVINCKKCPLFDACSDSSPVRNADESNEIILNWCKEHPVKTRQDKFLEMFPNARMHGGIITICPNDIGDSTVCSTSECYKCQKSYWLAEVEE